MFESSRNSTILSISDSSRRAPIRQLALMDLATAAIPDVLDALQASVRFRHAGIRIPVWLCQKHLRQTLGVGANRAPSQLNRPAPPRPFPCGHLLRAI